MRCTVDRLRCMSAAISSKVRVSLHRRFTTSWSNGSSSVEINSSISVSISTKYRLLSYSRLSYRAFASMYLASASSIPFGKLECDGLCESFIACKSQGSSSSIALSSSSSLAILRRMEATDSSCLIVISPRTPNLLLLRNKFSFMASCHRLLMLFFSTHGVQINIPASLSPVFLVHHKGCAHAGRNGVIASVYCFLRAWAWLTLKPSDGSSKIF